MMAWKRASPWHGVSGDFTIAETTQDVPLPFTLFFRGERIGSFASRDEAKKAAETWKP